MSEIRHSWGGLSMLNNVLCWERYGYDSEHGGPPPFASDLLTAAKRAAAIAKPPKCEWSIDVRSEGSIYAGTFRVWDAANPWVEPWQVGFTGYTSEERARQHYEREFANHKRLQDGVIEALIHYRETGEPTLESWRPASAWYWKHPKYQPDNRAYLRENEPGVICYEKFTNPAWDHLPGTIYVTVEARGPNRYVAECFAEGPNQYRRQRSERFEAPTYAEARALAETWVETVGRPFIARELENQVDYVEFTDPMTGQTFTGELIGVDADSPWRTTVFVKLDSPEEYRGYQRDGLAPIDRTFVRRVEKPTVTAPTA